MARDIYQEPDLLPPDQVPLHDAGPAEGERLHYH